MMDMNSSTVQSNNGAMPPATAMRSLAIHKTVSMTNVHIYDDIWKHTSDGKCDG